MTTTCCPRWIRAWRRPCRRATPITRKQGTAPLRSPTSPRRYRSPHRSPIRRGAAMCEQRLAPTFEKDCGVIIEGTFTVDSGSVRVYDLQGRLLGSELMRSGDDVMTVAKRLLRKGATPSFFAPLRYPPSSAH